jgi:hypothetical protein
VTWATPPPPHYIARSSAGLHHYCHVPSRPVGLTQLYERRAEGVVRSTLHRVRLIHTSDVDVHPRAGWARCRRPSATGCEPSSAVLEPASPSSTPSPTPPLSSFRIFRRGSGTRVCLRVLLAISLSNKNEQPLGPNNTRLLQIEQVIRVPKFPSTIQSNPAQQPTTPTARFPFPSSSQPFTTSEITGDGPGRGSGSVGGDEPGPERPRHP